MVSKKFRTTLLAGLGVLAASPAFAQGAWDPVVSQWALISAGGAIAIAAAFGATAQGRAVVGACESLARNPGAAPQIRFSLLLGLVLIVSLVIYSFVTALIIFFVLWNG
ncbi:MAG: ATP synthase F0 subunit C [Acidobacteria bacterium]|nr:ATP synthase F0 subunit C [Acidobacteriota bacterium]